MYGYCPSWALKWEYRKKLIMNEILQHQGDILSLQVSYVALHSLEKVDLPLIPQNYWRMLS